MKGVSGRRVAEPDHAGGRGGMAAHEGRHAEHSETSPDGGEVTT